jgi:L-ascorbate metabolism protein UlaG (beta-lactamase superfamily)
MENRNRKDKRMKITWLGQGGFMVDIDGHLILVDPYLSDSVEKKLNGSSKRLIPVDPEYLKIHPEVLICTHDHLDHTDPDTLRNILNSEQSIQVLCSEAAYKTVRELQCPGHNYILFNRGAEVTFNGIHIRAVKAVHSDPYAIGVVIAVNRFSFYITGDSLYSREVLDDIDQKIDLLAVCMNGAGNNMNMEDAYRFTRNIQPQIVIPMHWGMFEQAGADPDAFIEKFKGYGIKTEKLQPFKEYEIQVEV